MPMHLQRERQLLPFGIEPLVGIGMVPTIAAQLGLGVMGRMSQPARLEISEQPTTAEDPATQRMLRLMDPRTIDATRLLSFGAPTPQRLQFFGLFPFRPTEAPLYHQRQIALGGRQVLVT